MFQVSCEDRLSLEAFLKAKEFVLLIFGGFFESQRFCTPKFLTFVLMSQTGFVEDFLKISF